MGLVAADFLNQLKALLPFGPAWDLDGTTSEKLLWAWAEEFARVQARIDQLVEEADPRIAYELLIDYERIFGLPTDCMASIDQTFEQRHNALVSQMISVGGQSITYFIALATAAGFTITITEFRPCDVTMTVDTPLYDDNWAYAWQINASLSTVTYFLVNGGVDEALSSWGNNLLECLINRYKPAHTIAIFSYS